MWGWRIKIQINHKGSRWSQVRVWMLEPCSAAGLVPQQGFATWPAWWRFTLSCGARIQGLFVWDIFVYESRREGFSLPWNLLWDSKLIKPQACQVTSLPPHLVPNISKGQWLTTMVRHLPALCAAPWWISDTKTRQGQMRLCPTSAGWHWKLETKSNLHGWSLGQPEMSWPLQVLSCCPSSFHSGTSGETEESTNDIILARLCHLQHFLLWFSV